MKMRHLALAASAALSFGAIAGGGQQQSQTRDDASSRARADTETVRQAQDQLRAASGKLDQQTLAALGLDPSSGASSDRETKY